MSRVYLISETTGETEDYSSDEFSITFDPKEIKLKLLVKDKLEISAGVWLIDAIKIAEEYNKLLKDDKDIFIIYGQSGVTVLEEV